jgi:hypothetical protein
MNYYKVPSKSVITKELLEFATTAQNWQDYYNFKAIQVPVEMLSKDPFLVDLFRKHPFVAGIVQLSPYVCYDWHTDTRRGVGVNMLLTPEVKSHCLFTNAEGAQFSFEELVYEPDTYYLFNTQVRHTVINFYEPRYLFTLEFAADKDQLFFESLLEQIKCPSEEGRQVT